MHYLPVIQDFPQTQGFTGKALKYWTRLAADPAKVIELYYENGTSDQFHSKLKADLDLERMLSDKFNANELVLLFGMMPYSVLRLIGQESLGDDMPIRNRVTQQLGSLMGDMVHHACQVGRHARRMVLSFGKRSPCTTHGGGYTCS